jgi:hypothetical protein
MGAGRRPQPLVLSNGLQQAWPRRPTWRPVRAASAVSKISILDCLLGNAWDSSRLSPGSNPQG